MFHRPLLDVPDPFPSFRSSPPPSTPNSLQTTGIRRPSCATPPEGLLFGHLAGFTPFTRNGREEKDFTAPTSHGAGRARAMTAPVKLQGDEGADLRNMTSLDCVLREGSGVRQAQGDWCAEGVVEARSCTMSHTRPRNAKQPLCNSARRAPKDSQSQRKQSGSGRQDSRRSSIEKAITRAAEKAGTSLTERTRPRSSLHSEREGTRKKWKKRESARQEAEERAAEARHDLADLQKSEGKRERERMDARRRETDTHQHSFTFDTIYSPRMHFQPTVILW